MEIMEKFKVEFTAVTAFLSSLLGILYIPVMLMVLCNVIDYITGIIASIKRKDGLQSQVMLWGVVKKVCMWLLVVVGAVVDMLLKHSALQAGFSPPVQWVVASIVTMWIICTELISILENMLSIGVILPPFLLPLVKLIKEQTEKAGKQTNKEIKGGAEDGNKTADT